MGKQLLAADAASGQEGIEANDDDEDDEVTADEAAAARLWPGDEDEDESYGVMGDGEYEGTEEQGSDVRVRMDRASRDAALAARVINESGEPMSRLARQRLLKQAKREERLRLKEEKRALMMQRKRELRLQRGRK